MASDLFISHCTADREQAEAIREACESQGLTCWMAPRDIVPGTSWADAIVAGIDGAALVLLVHSEAANLSPMVRREIDAAAAAYKPILPVRIDQALPQQGMALYLSSTHWFDAPPPLAPHLPRLVDAVTRLVRPAAGATTGQPGPAVQGAGAGPGPGPGPGSGSRSGSGSNRVQFPEFGGQPAIAVLPFRSYAPDDEPFADGLTDELINALSGWRNFPVIARNSVFAYRGRDIDVRVIGRELGARYIISGAARRYGPQARVTLELVDVETAGNLLSEHYDHTSSNPFVMQDEIVRSIAGILWPEMLKLERERAVRRPATDANVYDLFERGMWHRYRNTREDLERAADLFRQALKIDPHYAPATAALSLCHNFAAQSHWTADVAAARAESLALARQAVADDPRDPHAHFALGVACMNVRRLPEAIQEFREAVRLNPSHAFAHANLGQVFNYLNRPREGLPQVELALRLNPHDPRRFMWLPYVATSHYLSRRYKACLEASEQALLANPEYPHAVRYMVAALGQLGRVAEARPLLALLRRYDRDMAGLEALTRNFFQDDAAEHLLEGIRRAGFT